jgi:CRISPR-associated protein Cas5d
MKEPWCARLLLWGPFACFTRPEFKVERLTYSVPTPSAMRAIFEAIFWKPAIWWDVQRITVLAPIRYISMKVNEIDTKKPCDIENSRMQRQVTMLRDVRYAVDASIKLTDQNGGDADLKKYQAMFDRRSEAGQYFKSPYFGCREYRADFRVVKDGEDLTVPPELAANVQKIGRVLLGNSFTTDADGHTSATPSFFNAELRNGVLVEEGQDRLPIFAPKAKELIGGVA